MRLYHKTTEAFLPAAQILQRYPDFFLEVEASVGRQIGQGFVPVSNMSRLYRDLLGDHRKSDQVKTLDQLDHAYCFITRYDDNDADRRYTTIKQLPSPGILPSLSASLSSQLLGPVDSS